MTRILLKLRHNIRVRIVNHVSQKFSRKTLFFHLFSIKTCGFWYKMYKTWECGLVSKKYPTFFQVTYFFSAITLTQYPCWDTSSREPIFFSQNSFFFTFFHENVRFLQENLIEIFSHYPQSNYKKISIKFSSNHVTKSQNVTENTRKFDWDLFTLSNQITRKSQSNFYHVTQFEQITSHYVTKIDFQK